eukprot:TRINITY_DN60038_c0_g1_i1.p1 TRINITY_DN60038_c0_g1~~TRINITY_DN60038_c0_g1_i1.p1  ORF type:complete len:162 (+),score=19.90 TRINITY_DN60038_c0_g1_i1:45-530(+)
MGCGCSKTSEVATKTRFAQIAPSDFLPYEGFGKCKTLTKEEESEMTRTLPTGRMEPDDKQKAGAPVSMRHPAGQSRHGVLRRVDEAIGEPECLQSYRSFDHEPSAADWRAGHPIAPCAVCDRRHMKSMSSLMKHVARSPSDLEASVNARRQQMKAARRDRS